MLLVHTSIVHVNAMGAILSLCVNKPRVVPATAVSTQIAVSPAPTRLHATIASLLKAAQTGPEAVVAFVTSTEGSPAAEPDADAVRYETDVL